MPRPAWSADPPTPIHSRTDTPWPSTTPSILDTGIASGALLRGTLVGLDSNGQLVNVGKDAVYDVLGVLMEPATAANQVVRYMSLRGATRAIVLTDNSAIVVGSKLYKQASGKVGISSTGSTLVGVAAEATGSVDATLITMRCL